MKLPTPRRWTTSGASLLIACLPQAAWSADELPRAADEVSVVTQPVTQVIDVALEERGTLVGQVTGPKGAPQAEAPIAVRQGTAVVARTTTDRRGIFYVTGLRGGVYQVASNGASQNLRAWAPDTAPPNARPGVQLVRGQGATSARGPILDFLTRPVVIGGLVATAIAVPIAVHNNNSDGGSTVLPSE